MRTGNCDLVTLKEAIRQFKKERCVPANAYSWHVKSARNSGTVHLGTDEIPVLKRGGSWCINQSRLRQAIAHHRDELARRHAATEDLAKGIIHGHDGDTIRTDNGGYKIVQGFRLVWQDDAIARKDRSGTWYCNVCNSPATEEHEREECHLCRDWNGCGRDCTLSKIFCEKCGATLGL